jgi:hypothetical protein
MPTTAIAAVALVLATDDGGAGRVMFALMFTVAVLATVGGFAAMVWAHNR